SVFYPDRVQGTVSWMAGGFVGRSWDDVMMIWPYTAIGIIGSMISIRWLTLLSLGDDTARTLGVHVERCRLSLLVLASLLAASAVSVSGMLGFVGLIVPHVARLIVGVDYRYLIPTSMVFGGILIVYADTLARMMIAPGEIPVGVLMSFLGAPFFLYLLKGVGRR
ncbi:iron ABC transporter permease, partial [Veillonella sp.]